VTLEKGEFPDLFVAFLSTACHQCAEPACVSVCPVDAVTKREVDGVVVVDKETCLGKDDCSQCFDACPYDAPQFGAEENGKMQKCHFCLDRLAENRKPACVDSCPMRALDAGPMEELRGKYGSIMEAEGFSYDKDLKPQVIFKPKKDTGDHCTKKVEIAPRPNG
jgi:anaerobic dimethyl sulfoxide reductase subunit B (iron-sulfur subunit)